MRGGVEMTEEAQSICLFFFGQNQGQCNARTRKGIHGYQSNGLSKS